MKVPILGRNVEEQYPMLKAISDCMVRFETKYGKKPEHLLIDISLWNEWSSIPSELLSDYTDMHVRMRWKKNLSARQVCVSDGTNYVCERVELELT